MSTTGRSEEEGRRVDDESSEPYACNAPSHACRITRVATARCIVAGLAIVLTTAVVNARADRRIAGQVPLGGPTSDAWGVTADQRLVRLDLLGQIGGAAGAVAAQGDLVFVGVGPRLVVVDVSDPLAPRTLGQSQVLGGFVQGLAVVGATVYVAALHGGVLVVDVSDPSRPAVVGAASTPDMAMGVVAVGSLLYVADNECGLRILDVSEPWTPHEVGAVDTPQLAARVAVSGALAVVADVWGGLRVIDISDPTRPVEVGAFDDNVCALDVAVVGTTAYVTLGTSLAVVDLQDPTSPRAVASVPVDMALGVFVEGTTAFVTARQGRVVAIDCADPFDVHQVGEVTTPPYPHDLRVVDSRGYVTTAQGLSILDVSDKAKMRVLASTSVMGAIGSVAVVDNTAYVAGDKGLTAIDVADPSRPRQLGAVDTVGVALAVFVTGGTAYVANQDGGLWIIDVSQPTAPREVGAAPGGLPGAGAVFVADTIAFVACSDGLHLVDVSDPAHPAEISTVALPGDAASVYVSDSVAYVAAGSGGLRIVDVHDPSSPHELGQVGGGLWALGIDVADGIAYVADGNAKLWLVDVNVPASPAVVGVIDLATQGVSVAVAGGLAYVASADAGLQVIDVGDPANPRVAGSRDTAGWSKGVAVSERTAFVADDEGGLLVLGAVETTPTPGPSCTPTQTSTGTPTAEVTASQTPTHEPTPTSTLPPSPSSTPSLTPSSTCTPRPTATATLVPTATTASTATTGPTPTATAPGGVALADPPLWEQATLEPEGPDPRDPIGMPLAVDGNTVIAGWPQSSGDPAHPLPNAGAAYIFTRTATTWRQAAVLSAAEPKAYEDFGGAVALDGDTALVGACGIPYAVGPVAPECGAAYVYIRTRTEWALQAVLRSSDHHPGDRFGASVAIDGDTALVGAWQHGEKYSNEPESGGSAYLFERRGAAWQQTAILRPSVPHEFTFFGKAVALDGDTALVGTVSDWQSPVSHNSGAVYVFARSENSWAEQAVLRSGRPEADWFGQAVALDGDTALVGASSDRGDPPRAGSWPGAVHCYQRAGVAWTEEPVLRPDEGTETQNFGWSVAVDGAMAVVGASGPSTDAAHVFVRDASGWQARGALQPRQPGDHPRFGWWVAVDDLTLLVGSEPVAFVFSAERIFAPSAEAGARPATRVIR